jgi:hypothetical protein
MDELINTVRRGKLRPPHDSDHGRDSDHLMTQTVVVTLTVS